MDSANLHLPSMTIFILCHPPSSSAVLGLTALHMAVLTHNAVVQDLSHATAPQSPQTAALMQKRKLLGECINTLLLMGASYGTKVPAAFSVLLLLRFIYF